MIRLTIRSFFSVLIALPLLADSQIAGDPGAAATPKEVVNWTAGVPYDYDHSGNVRRVGQDRFVYDRVGRLVRAEINGIVRVYTYDAFGNRTECAHMPGTPSSGDCQLDLDIDPATNRVKGVEYDAAGNVTSYYGHTYTYDEVNMTVRDDGGGLSKEYVYTADDERLAVHTLGAGWTWTVRDKDGKVLREFTSTEQGTFRWARDYVYRDGLLLASKQQINDTVSTYHYHLDHLGTPRRVTDSRNRIVGFHDYHAFGPEVPGGLTEASQSRLQYTGHERDKSATGEGPDTLDYMFARYYSPTLGRFLSLDPLNGYPAEPQSWNRYAYTRNNPMSLIDPDGLTENKPIPCYAGRGERPCEVEPEKAKSGTEESEGQQQGSEADKKPKLDVTNGVKLTWFPEGDWARMEADFTFFVADNTILINAHGTPSTVAGMDKFELAAKIREKTNFRPGTTIILNSCNSAFGDDSIAESLSRVMQTTVIGNSQSHWTFGPFDLGIWGTYGAPKGGRKEGGWPDLLNPGKQVKFVSGKRVED